MNFVDMPDPKVGRGEILVRVRASSVNPVDWKVRNGSLRFVSGWNPPKVLGADFAGVIEKTGSDVQGCAVGEKVYGMVPAFKGGAYAEKVVARPKEIAPMPANLSFEEAAVLPLVSLTVYQALFERAKQKPDQHVLVNGCTGGLGHIAVQMAKARGFKVTGVCSAGNLPVARQLGADHVIDYRAQSPLEGEQRYDLIFDAVANLRFREAKQALSPDGVYVSSIPTPENMLVAPLLNSFRRQKHRYVAVAPNGAVLQRITEMVEAGLRPTIEKVYQLDEIRQAHARSESGRVVGKLALRTD